MLVGITVNNVKPPPQSAPRRATFGFLAANTLSIKSRAITSPSPKANNAAQLSNAPFSIAYRADKSIVPSGNEAEISAHGVSAYPPAKNMKAAQNATIAI